MKPIHYIILGALIIIVLLVVLKKYTDKIKADKAQQDAITRNIYGFSTITAIVDPTTGQEFIIADIGENNLDGQEGSKKANVELIKVINNISQRTAIIPKNLVLKLYDAKMNLLSSTSITNPYQQTVPTATTAVLTQAQQGINYTCASGNLTGPGFYEPKNGSEPLLFGMFCK